MEFTAERCYARARSKVDFQGASLLTVYRKASGVEERGREWSGGVGSEWEG